MFESLTPHVAKEKKKKNLEDIIRIVKKDLKKFTVVTEVNSLIF